MTAEVLPARRPPQRPYQAESSTDKAAAPTSPKPPAPPTTQCPVCQRHHPVKKCPSLARLDQRQRILFSMSLLATYQETAPTWPHVWSVFNTIIQSFMAVPPPIESSPQRTRSIRNRNTIQARSNPPLDYHTHPPGRTSRNPSNQRVTSEGATEI